MEAGGVVTAGAEDVAVAQFADTKPAFEQLLSDFIDSDTRYRELKAAMEEAKERCDYLREQCKGEFEKMGVSSMKSRGRTVYIHSQIWAGKAPGISAAEVVEELKSLGLDNHISINSQSFSAYVREVAKEHPELVNAKGEITAEPAQILSVLPGKLSELCSVTDKVDLKIRKS